MPTLNKLEYLDETKGQIKTALNDKFNSQIQDTDTFRSYVSKINNIYTNWPKVEGEDISLTLTPTKKAKMKVDLKGNTQQNGTPTPDTPIPVQVVSGDNTIKVSNGDNTEYEEYPITLGNIELCKIGTYQDKIAKSTGKNLFDKDNANVLNAYVDNTEIGTSAKAKITYIKCQPNTTYTISKDNSGNNNRFGIATTTTTPAINVSTMQYVGDNSASSLTITTNSTAEYLVIQFYHTDETKITQQQVLNSIMINEGSTALPYEPYGKVWYLNKKIGKVVLDGSENWTYQDQYPRFMFSSYTGDKLKTDTCNYISHYIKGQTADANNTLNVWAVESNKQVLVHDERFTTKEQFNAWLVNNNVIIYGQLYTPTYEEITDTTLISQLEALKNAYSYDTQTNISQTNDNLGFIIDASALMKGSE